MVTLKQIQERYKDNPIVRCLADEKEYRIYSQFIESYNGRFYTISDDEEIEVELYSFESETYAEIIPTKKEIEFSDLVSSLEVLDGKVMIIGEKVGDNIVYLIEKIE